MLLFGISLLGVVGLAMLYGAWHLSQKTRVFKRTAISASGVIVELKETHTRERNTGDVPGYHDSVAYYPIVSFTNRDGGKVSFTSDTAVDQYAFPVGEPVKVLYDPAHPDQARVDSFDSLQGGVVVLAVMGVMFLGGAVLAMLLLYLNKTPDTAVFVAVAFGLMSALLLTGGWYLGRNSVYLRAHGSKTTGVVINTDAGTLLEFTTQDGRVRKFHTQVSSNPPKYALGDKVPVIYDSNRPGRVRIDSFDELWLVPTLVGGMGVACLLATAFALFMKTRER